MAGFVRMKTKRVTYPLDDKVKASLVGGGGGDSYDVSSGSEHSADYVTPCLSELVHDFLQEDDDTSSETRFPDSDSDSERVDSVSDSDAIDSVLRSAALSGNADSYWKLLRSHFAEAAELFSCLRSTATCKSAILRSVMSFLRDRGHNAAICKTSWSSAGHVTAGSYEFIDVVSVQSSSSPWQTRYFVDLDFAAEFEIARPTSSYSRMLQSLPKDFAGSSEDLKRIVRVMSDAVKRSLRSRELSVPPWRKNRYMQNKWFGPYKRTTNPLTEKPLSLVSTAAFGPVCGAKCRWLGSTTLFPTPTLTAVSMSVLRR